MHKKFSLFTALLLTYSSAMATDWTSIIKDAKHEVFVDIDSYGVSEQFPFLVAKTIYQQPQSFVSANKSIEYAISITTLQYNCEKAVYRMRTIKLLDKKNKPIKTFRINANFKKLATNTDAFSIGQLTCQVHQMVGGTTS